MLLLITVLLILLIILTLVMLFSRTTNTENYNPWNNDFKLSSIAPFKEKSTIQGQGFARPDCQMHPNCFGCKGYAKSDLPFNLSWDGIQNQGHIALLFITGRNKPCVDNLWGKWIQNDYFVAFNHGNSPLSYAINIPTEEITYDNLVPAIIKLIEAALDKPSVKGCVFISESCIPTKSAAHVYKKLINSHSILLFVNENLDKAQFFHFLSRQAMEIVLNDYKNTKFAVGYTKSLSNGGNDELLIPQLLKNHPEIPTIHGNVTFQCHALNCINHENGWDPVSSVSSKNITTYPHFDKISTKFAQLLLSNKSLFARKFTKGTSVDGESLESFLSKNIMFTSENFSEAKIVKLQGGIGNLIVHNLFYSIKKELKIEPNIPVNISYFPTPIKLRDEEINRFKSIDKKWFKTEDPVVGWDYGYLDEKVRPYYLEYWRLCRPILKRVYDEYLIKMVVKYPVLHFRCSDVPTNRHPCYHTPKISFIDAVLYKIKEKQYTTVIFMTCNSHGVIEDKQKSVCINLEDFYIKYIESKGIKVIKQCNEILYDMSTMYHSPLLVSLNNSSLAFVVGISKDPKQYITGKIGKEKGEYNENALDKADWEIISINPLLHREVNDYYDLSEVRRKLMDV